MIKTNRSVVKFFLLSLVTFGIYDLIFFYTLNEDMNLIQKEKGKKQMNFIAVVLLGMVTLGIVPLIWFIKLVYRISEEAKERRVEPVYNPLWVVLASLLLGFTVVCPIIAIHQLCQTMNALAEEYNGHIVPNDNPYAFYSGAQGGYYNAPNYDSNVRSRDILPRVKMMNRHNFFSSFTGVLLILVGLSPLLLLFLPVFTFTQNSNGMFTDNASINILDIIFSIFKSDSELRVGLHADFQFISDTEGMPISQAIYFENIYALLAWYGFAAIFGIVLFILGLILVIRGRLNHHFGPVVATFVYMINLLFVVGDTIRLGWYYNNAISKCVQTLGADAPTGYKFWPIAPIVIAGVALLANLLVLAIFLFYFFGRYYKEDIEMVDIPTNEDFMYQPYEKNDGFNKNTLPKGIMNIGGHAFAKNTNLQIATISKGVKTLGPGAFSNCLKLQIVNLPLSIEKIDYNCFFNCVSLSRINYEGTKEDWSKISRGSNWLLKAGTTTVICKDGAISVNPYR